MVLGMWKSGFGKARSECVSRVLGIQAEARALRDDHEVGLLSIPLVGRERGRVLELFCAETHRVPGYRAVPIAMFTVSYVDFVLTV